MSSPRPSPSPSTPVSRRVWLGGLFLAGLHERLGFGDDLDPIRAIGAKARLGEFKTSKSKHFLGIGDAPTTYQVEALAAAESIGVEFLAHFNDRGFKLAWPAARSIVVVLAGVRSFAAFTGDAAEVAVGGHYDVETNRLVIFDFRRSDRPLTTQAEVVNSRTLAHETIHQLSYNTGLLEPKADVPLFVDEGLGAYGEVWRPRNRGKIGQVNAGWLDVLKGAGGGSAWIPVAKLAVEDKLFDDPALVNQAYAQSWLFTHRALKTKGVVAEYRAYLELVAKRREPKERLDDLRKFFGDLDRLDAELKRYAKRPVGSA